MKETKEPGGEAEPVLGQSFPGVVFCPETKVAMEVGKTIKVVQELKESKEPVGNSDSCHVDAEVDAIIKNFKCQENQHFIEQDNEKSRIMLTSDFNTYLELQDNLFQEKLDIKMQETSLSEVLTNLSDFMMPYLKQELVERKQEPSLPELERNDKEEAVSPADQTVSRQKLAPDPSIAQSPRFKCYICDATYSLKRNLKFHIRRNHNSQKLRCDMCEFTSRIKESMLNHIQFRHQDVRYNCAHCKFSSARERDLKRHVIGHKTYGYDWNGKWNCSLCKSSFSRENDLQRHIQGNGMGNGKTNIKACHR